MVNTYTLLFVEPSNADKSVLNKIKNNILIKAEVSVNSEQNGKKIKSIYDYADEYNAYDSRVKALSIIKKILNLNANDNKKRIIDLFDFQNDNYASLLVNSIWSELETMLRLISSLKAFLNSIHSPFALNLFGINKFSKNIKEIVLDTIKDYSPTEVNHIKNTLEEKELNIMDLYGIYNYQGFIGKETSIFYAGYSKNIPAEMVAHKSYLELSSNKKKESKVYFYGDNESKGMYLETTLIHLDCHKKGLILDFYFLQKHGSISINKKGITDVISGKLLSEIIPVECIIKVTLSEDNFEFSILGLSAWKISLQQSMATKNYISLLAQSGKVVSHWKKLIFVQNANVDNIMQPFFKTKKLNINKQEGSTGVPVKLATVSSGSHMAYYKNQEIFFAPLYYEGFLEGLKINGYEGYYITFPSKICLKKPKNYLFMDLSQLSFIEKIILKLKEFVFKTKVFKIKKIISEKLNKSMFNFNLKNLILEHCKSLSKTFLLKNFVGLSVSKFIFENKIAGIIGPRQHTFLTSKNYISVPCASLELSILGPEVRCIAELLGKQEKFSKIFYWGKVLADELDNVKVLNNHKHEFLGLHTLDFFSSMAKNKLKSNLEKEQMWKFFGVPIECPVILFTTPLGTRSHAYIDINLYIESLKATVSVLDELKKGVVVIKPLSHSDDPCLIMEIVNTIKSDRIKVLYPLQEFHNIQYFLASDVVISTPSTIIAESLAAGVPAISLVFDDTYKHIPFPFNVVEAFHKITFVAKNKSELSSMLKNLIQNPNDSQVIHDMEAFNYLYGNTAGNNLNSILNKFNNFLN